MTDLERILTPAIWMDVYLVLPALLRLRGAAGPHDRLVALRLAEVARRFEPADAHRLLDDLPEGPDPVHPTLQPAVVRAHALLEADRRAEASLLVPDAPVEAGVRDLLLARVALSRGDLDEAVAHLDRSIALARRAEDPLAVEVEAEALGVRARVRMVRREPTDDWDRVEAICEAHHAPIARTMVRLHRDAHARGTVAQLADAAAAMARRHEQRRYTQPYEADRAAVAPIPLHVHGAARLHAADPDAYVEAILTLSALAWRVGDRLDGYETAAYGLRVGERLFGAPVAETLRPYLDELVAPLDPDARERLVGAVRARAAARRPAEP